MTSMERVRRIGLAGAVVLLSYIGATPYRQPGPPLSDGRTVPRDSRFPAVTLLLGEGAQAQGSTLEALPDPHPDARNRPAALPAPLSDAARPAYLLAPRPLADMTAVPPPPTIGRDFPEARSFGSSATPPNQLTAPGNFRRYRIRDGDRLKSVAERFLGNPADAARIYQLNRDVLPSPDLLPIGAEIRIPLPAGATAQW